MKQFKITTFLNFLLLFVLVVTTLSSCKSTSVVPPTTTETTKSITTKEVLRDTTFTIPKDSSYYKAYLDCVNGNVVLKQNTKPTIQSGKFLQPPKVNLQNNILNIDCKAEAQELFAEWKDIYVKEHQSDVQRIPYPVIQPLSWWQNTQIILGRIFLGILILIAIVVGLRLTKVI